MLSYVPYEKELDFAIGLARGSALCVVETAARPVAGWAASVGAVNLITGVQSSMEPELASHLDQLAFYGNNGYSRGFGRQRAQHVLEDIQRDGYLNRGFLMSALAARGISPNGCVVIGEMVDAMQGSARR
ncbi:hypothetical protein ACK8GE_21565 [Micromonosporaceae bacterium DT194]|uniref:hypothetical protein n=1 Tax=Melissospora conviva TaxID=3388432 RepID=UPI003C14E865